MSKTLAEKLYKKGWEKEEILRTLNIIKRARQDKHPHVKFMDSTVYWILLMVIAVLNFGIATAFIPSMLSFRWPFLYFIIGIIGYVFGLIIETVVRSMEHLEARHHVALGLIIPFIGLANIIVIGSIPNSVQNALNFGFSHNLYLVGAVYSFFLILPYILLKVFLKKGYYS